MRCLGTLAVLCVGLVGGAFLTVADPALPGQVVHSATADVEWLAGTILSRTGDATRHSPGPVPEPTGTRPIVLITPDPTPETTVDPVPVTTARPAPTPITLPRATPYPTPTPHPTLGWMLPWSGSDRAWALSTLQLDMQLDTQAETTYPAYQAYYAGWALHWAQAIALIQGLEYPQALPPSPATLNPFTGWFNLAIQLHQQDTAAHPQDQAWNDTWIANYRRLDTLWAAL